MTRVVQLSQVAIDGGTQPRCDINESLVAEYAEAMRDGAEFPPIVVFHDGVKFWLADGFHRTHAARRAGLDVFDADVRDGTRRDAILFSVGANAAHGSRRTNADKRKAVMTLVTDSEWGTWTAAEIARRCCVSNDFAARMKRDHESSLSSNESEPPPPRTYTTKHGTKATMNTGGIGRKKSTKESPPVEERSTPEPLGVGLRKATEAIGVLGSIPKSDKLRDAALNRVIDWIQTNR